MRSPTRTEIRQLTAYFSWSAWAGSTLRPDKDYTLHQLLAAGSRWSATTVTANVVVWSVLSLIVLLAGIGALFAAFGRWGERIGWRGRQADTISFRPPGDVAVTPTQRACAYFFLVVGLLFVIQIMVGAASEHYRADLTSFFGFDLARWLPYNLVRTWHVQLVDLLDGDVVPGRRHLPRPDRRRAASRAGSLARLRPAGCPRRGRLRQHDR